MQGTVRVTHPNRSRGNGVPIRALIAIAVLGLVLFGYLLHRHESAAEAATCSYCQAGVETPVPDLSGVLATTSFVVVWCVAPAPRCRLPRVVHFSTLVPRAPPVTTLPLKFWEGCVGVA